MIYVSYISLFVVSVCMLRFAYNDFKSSIIENSDLIIFLIFTVIFNLSSNWFIYDFITILSIVASIAYWTFSFFYKDGQFFGGGDLKLLIIMTFLFPPYIYWQIIFLGFFLSLFYFIPWFISVLFKKWGLFHFNKPHGVPLAVPIMLSYFIVISNLLIQLYF